MTKKWIIARAPLTKPLRIARRFGHLGPLLVLLVAVSSAAAADWPQFRGPTADGHARARNLPTTWNETTNVAWKTEIPGKGWSSPVLAAGKLYVTTAVPQDPGSASGGDVSLRAMCLDAASGAVLWDQEVFRQPPDAPKIHTKNSHASPTPIVAGERLFVHFGHQGTACLDLAGQIVWKSTAHQYAPVHGNGGSPALVAGLLVFSCDGADDPYVVALDAATGQERWRFDRPTEAASKFSFSTPAVITVSGQQQLLSPGSGMVNALDPATGSELWRVRYGEGYSVIPRPIFGHGLVFVATGYNSPTVMAIHPGGSGDVTDTHVAWTVKKGAPHTPSLLLVGDELYMLTDKTGVLTCLDARTGQEHWQERIGGNYSASPLFADDKIYVQSEEGPAVVLKPGTRFDKLADAGFQERTLASYAVGERELYIRTERHLWRVEDKPQ
jgi:outer membrane protein assembly factor BamB